MDPGTSVIADLFVGKSMAAGSLLEPAAAAATGSLSLMMVGSTAITGSQVRIAPKASRWRRCVAGSPLLAVPRKKLAPSGNHDFRFRPM